MKRRLTPLLLTILLDACAAPVEAPPSPQDPTVTLGLVMFQDWAGPADTGFRLAWDTAVRAPADGFLEHFPFIARGVEEGTEVRLMLGTDDERTIAARRTLRGGIEVEWFADYTSARGGVRILQDGETADGIPARHLCGPFDLWLEAVDASSAVVATSTPARFSRLRDDCAATPTTW